MGIFRKQNQGVRCKTQFETQSLISRSNRKTISKLFNKLIRNFSIVMVHFMLKLNEASRLEKKVDENNETVTIKRPTWNKFLSDEYFQI